MKLKINRERWIRGEDSGFRGDNSFLVRETDLKMCCLGFYGKECGISEETLLGCQAPLPSHGYPDWLFAGPSKIAHSEDATKLMLLNDRSKLPERTREDMIASIFAKHDIVVEFV